MMMKLANEDALSRLLEAYRKWPKTEVTFLVGSVAWREEKLSQYR